MSEAEISPLKQLSVLSKSLFKLLDEEFELLSGRDFLSVEKIQAQKVEKMQELDILWKSVGSGDLSEDQLVLFDEIRSKLEECKDKHLRNDILLKKQMEITKNLISVLTNRNDLQTNVYNKLGKLS
jgi:flagellar biosynthesis/type III secretory pathway chaperone